MTLNDAFPVLFGIARAKDAVFAPFFRVLYSVSSFEDC
jgi:hypothetical protein